MDHLSITAAAVTLMTVCVSVAHAIKTIIEKAKKSNPALIKLLQKIEHVRLYLAQL